MNKSLIIIFILLSFKIGYSQSTFTTVYYDSLSNGIISKNLIKALDGGFLIVGKYDEVDPKGLLIKIDSLGSVLWSKIFDISPLG